MLFFCQILVRIEMGCQSVIETAASLKLEKERILYVTRQLDLL